MLGGAPQGEGYCVLGGDPAAVSYDAVTAGLLRLGPNKLAGIYDLRLLNQALRVSGTAPVSADGLGAQ